MAKVHVYLPTLCRYHSWRPSPGWGCTTREQQLLLHSATRPGNWEWVDTIMAASISQSDTNGWQAYKRGMSVIRKLQSRAADWDVRIFVAIAPYGSHLSLD